MAIEKYGINWMDGMKMSSAHFIESDAHHIDRLRDAVQFLLNDHNYGLVDSLDGAAPSIEFDLTRENNRFGIKVRSCSAITRGGTRIEFNDKRGTRETISAEVSEVEYQGKEDADLMVVMIADPFSRKEFGEPDSDESPMRAPYIAPAVRLEIVPWAQYSRNHRMRNHLPVGRINWRDGEFKWDDNYIPPCASISAEDRLEKVFYKIQSQLQQMQSLVMDIVETIHKTAGLEETDKNLAGPTEQLCRQVLEFTTGSEFEFKNTLVHGSPVELVKQLSHLAARIFSTLRMIPKKQKEELFSYYAKWVKFDPGEFKDQIGQILNLQYDHVDTMATLGEAGNFVAQLLNFWEILSGLKFIGEKPEKTLIVATNKAPNLL